MRTLWKKGRAWARGKGGDPTVIIDLNAPEREAATAPVSVRGLCVLLVDDDAETRSLLTGALRHYGADVVAVESATAAMAVLERLHPQVLVSNCRNDEVDAALMLRRLRALEAERNRRIPTIALTAHAGTHRVLDHFALGFQVTVPKSVPPHELAAVIQRLVGSPLSDIPR